MRQFTTVNEKIKEKLDRKVNLIGKVNQEDFYLEVWTYLQEIFTNPLIMPLIRKLELGKFKDLKKLHYLTKKSKRELIHSKNKLTQIIKNKKINDQYITKKLTKINQFASDKRKSTENFV